MPSSAVQMEARSPMSLFLNRAVKRKSDAVIAEGASGERELNQEVRVVGSRKWCAVRCIKAQCMCVSVWLMVLMIESAATAVFICLQECGVDSVKRPCNSLGHQPSVGVPWDTPYHLNMSATQNVRIALYFCCFVFHGCKFRLLISWL